ncbi:antibiotic biosynthesis monooxygenase [Kineococcus sp. T13]|uniref:antibiotic biosynthesis monooxygenase n=1 Tax=Kineococcus vitellinus TaxID=2696565 RepID=UPI001413123C|nr:antibiotic biosynthesis monooxygenase [Kineococcus vitellinus]
MIIVAGHLIVDPADRGAFLAGCEEVVRRARATEGCLDFSIAADVVQDDRGDVFERWVSQAALRAFRGSGLGPEQTAVIRAASVLEHDVWGERPPG